jgi:hypothetical protein
LYCAKIRTGFDKPDIEFQFQYHPVETRSDDGAVVNPVYKNTASSLHACSGDLVGNVYGFYGEGEIARTHFSGTGKCTILNKDFPEPGLTSITCFLNLRGLKEPYVGGVLTTNTLTSRNHTSEESDPPGYTHFSIATVRLWKRP